MPAKEIPVRRQIGMLFVRSTVYSSALLCREHGVKYARWFLIRTCIQGWWGVISFFVNFIAIATDLAAIAQYRRLAPPEGAEVVRASEERPRVGTLIWVILGIIAVCVLAADIVIARSS